MVKIVDYKIKALTKKISDNHNDSFWYEGDIAEVKKPNGTILRLIATGEIRIHNKAGELVHDGCKERNSGIKLENDKDLKKIGQEYTDKYRWENNNWFEVIFKKKGDSIFERWTFGDTESGYDEAIQMLKDYYDDKEC